MAYVIVPRDLTNIKNKVVLNLTKRQLVCFGIAAGIGLPFYFLTRGSLGNSTAMTGMVFLMVPAFLFAMYEKDGLPLERFLWNWWTVRFRRPPVRRYETAGGKRIRKAQEASAGMIGSSSSSRKGGRRHDRTV